MKGNIQMEHVEPTERLKATGQRKQWMVVFLIASYHINRMHLVHGYSWVFHKNKLLCNSQKSTGWIITKRRCGSPDPEREESRRGALQCPPLPLYIHGWWWTASWVELCRWKLKFLTDSVHMLTFNVVWPGDKRKCFLIKTEKTQSHWPSLQIKDISLRGLWIPAFGLSSCLITYIDHISSDIQSNLIQDKQEKLGVELPLPSCDTHTYKDVADLKV